VTLPPHRVGDKGQRFEVRFYLDGEQPEDERPLGYAESLKGAREMRAVWLRRGDVTRCVIVDRQTGKPVT